MATFIDTETIWAFTFHEVILVFGPFMVMVPIEVSGYQVNCCIPSMMCVIWASLIQNPTLIVKVEVFLKKSLSLGSY